MVQTRFLSVLTIPYVLRNQLNPEQWLAEKNKTHPRRRFWGVGFGSARSFEFLSSLFPPALPPTTTLVF
jgi:hypothetical protein